MEKVNIRENTWKDITNINTFTASHLNATFKLWTEHFIYLIYESSVAVGCHLLEKRQIIMIIVFRRHKLTLTLGENSGAECVNISLQSM
jgi:hypothetical protein